MWQIDDSVVEDLVRHKQDLTAIDYYGEKFPHSSQLDAIHSTSDTSDSWPHAADSHVYVSFSIFTRTCFYGYQKLVKVPFPCLQGNLRELLLLNTFSG